MEYEPRRSERALSLPDGRLLAARKVTRPMIALGVILLIAALLIPKLAVLWAIGIIVLIIGVILAVLGGMGRAVGGRRHYY
ncbi:MAG TPA: DUF6131 family protein [Solirubrobacteraceae bacterium]